MVPQFSQLRVGTRFAGATHRLISSDQQDGWASANFLTPEASEDCAKSESSSLRQLLRLRVPAVKWPDVAP